MEARNPERLTWAAFALTVFLGGNNAIAVRFSNAELPPFFGAALRFGVAALILFALVLIFRLPLPRGRSLSGAILFGFLANGLNYALIYWSLLHVQASLTMVILALVPLLTFILACLHRQESFRWEALAGALLAVCGIGIISWDQLSADVPVLPLLAIFLGAVCFAEATVLIKSFPRTHPITTNAVALITGAMFLGALSAVWQEKPTLPVLPSTWAALVYLIVFGSVVAFVLALYVIKRWTASASSYQFVLFPVVTTISGAWLAKETISAVFLLGGLLVMSGVYIGGIVRPDTIKRIFSGKTPRLETPCEEC